jgi:hypothetical protein
MTPRIAEMSTTAILVLSLFAICWGGMVIGKYLIRRSELRMSKQWMTTRDQLASRIEFYGPAFTWPIRKK